MRVFVTGASGFIGSAVVPELLDHGHEVLGLARSDEKAAALEATGAQVHRGSLDDPASLQAGAEAADAVIHLAYVHDFSDMVGAARTDQAAITALVAGLEGRDAPLAIASGFAGITPTGPVMTEQDPGDGKLFPRAASAALVLAAAQRGVRSSVVRLAPTVHGPEDGGFVAELVRIARERGTSGFPGDGTNRWPAVHVRDAGALFRLAIEQAPAGSILHGTGEEGVPTREIAEALGRGLGLPAVSIPADDVAEHFGWLGGFFGADLAASSAHTRELLGWEPTHPSLLADLDAGLYTS